jgi:hypothetical protein
MRPLHAITLALMLGCAGYPQVVRASCGDGVLEPESELCDDGAANGTDACCTTECDFVDGDRDGVCDAYDPCADSSPIFSAVALRMTGFATEAEDDTFRLTGVLAPDAPLDLATTGFAIVLGNRYFGALAHAAIPPAAWRPGARGGWTYRDGAGTIGGVTSVVIKGRGDGTFALRVQGRRRDYARRSDIRPIRVTIALAAAGATGARCGETTLSIPRCTFAATGNTLRCEPPASQRRCPAAADAAVVCDAKNAAAAEDAFLTMQGQYYSGDCSGLPGFTSSPDVVCVASGAGDTVYSLTTASPTSSIVCVYSSIPRAGDPNLVCR